MAATDRMICDVLEDMLSYPQLTPRDADLFLHARAIEPADLKDFIGRKYSDYRNLRMQEQYRIFESRTGFSYR